jgi:pSer/pThr/pTyr-binding forkhead associated (FHA) protein
VQQQPVQEQAAEPPLQQQPTPAPPETPAEILSGHLVIQESNVNLQIPGGKQEVVLGREDPVSGIFPDIDLDPYGGQDAGIGRKHAKLTSQGGQTYIEDLNSVNGTVVNKQRIPSGEPVPLGNGDEIRLGLMVLLYYTN